MLEVYQQSKQQMQTLNGVVFYVIILIDQVAQFVFNAVPRDLLILPLLHHRIIQRFDLIDRVIP